MDLTKHIRTVPDFPAPGIMFRDVTTLFAVPEAFCAMISQFKEQWQDSRIDYIAGIDTRGFIIGGALAHDLDIGFVPLRKKGKLPYETITEDYELEYGTATLEVHTDAVPAGANVLVMDDLIATAARPSPVSNCCSGSMPGSWDVVFWWIFPTLVVRHALWTWV